jgi:hypothetical protein
MCPPTPRVLITSSQFASPRELPLSDDFFLAERIAERNRLLIPPPHHHCAMFPHRSVPRGAPCRHDADRRSRNLRVIREDLARLQTQSQVKPRAPVLLLVHSDPLPCTPLAIRSSGGDLRAPGAYTHLVITTIFGDNLGATKG